MPPVPTSFDVLVYDHFSVYRASFKPVAVRIRQQRPCYDGFQALTKSPQHFPCAIARIVTAAQILSELRRKRQVGLFF
jgi:hypothetical protein